VSKRKERKRVAELYENVVRIAEGPPEHAEAPAADGGLAASPELARLLEAATEGPRELPKMKKFRFQLLHQWMVTHLEPCRVADVGGGKGLLAYLLQRSGWEVVVIDPLPQALPTKYRDPVTDRQTRIAEAERVPHLDLAFQPELARDFELLVAMHAHGCILPLIDAAARYGREAIVLPCCIIHEPLVPARGVHWLQCVVDYAVRQGLRVAPFRLNFSGQNIGLHVRSRTP
jgi:hypothetical protein